MSADHLPATAIDIYRMLPEGTRCEVIYNELTMSPSPTSDHQLLIMDLSAELYFVINKGKLGRVIPSPMDVYLEDHISVIQPDILVLLNENLHYIKRDGVYGAPNIVIEVLSASNRNHDTKRKKSLYEKAGVKEYFIIDPDTKEVTLFTLDETGKYQQSYQDKNILRSDLTGFSLNF